MNKAERVLLAVVDLAEIDTQRYPDAPLIAQRLSLPVVAFGSVYPALIQLERTDRLIRACWEGDEMFAGQGPALHLHRDDPTHTTRPLRPVGQRPRPRLYAPEGRGRQRAAELRAREVRTWGSLGGIVSEPSQASRHAASLRR